MSDEGDYLGCFDRLILKEAIWFWGGDKCASCDWKAMFHHSVRAEEVQPQVNDFSSVEETPEVQGDKTYIWETLQAPSGILSGVSQGALKTRKGKLLSIRTAKILSSVGEARDLQGTRTKIGCDF